MENFGDSPGGFRLIWRPGDTVQNLESPGLSGRVDSPGNGYLLSIIVIMIITILLSKFWLFKVITIFNEIYKTIRK